MVSTTVAVASTAPHAQPYSSRVEVHFSVLPLLTPGDTVCEDLQGSTSLNRERGEVAIRLVEACLVNLEGVGNDLAVSPLTVSKRSSPVKHLRAKNDRFRGEVSRSVYEAGSSGTFPVELEASRRFLADHNVEIGRL